MTLEEVGTIPNGVGIIYWKDGGTSLASFGCTRDGTRWFCPCNWVSGIPCIYWEMIDRVEMIATQVHDEITINISIKL